MTANSFDLPIDLLRNRQNVKWTKYGRDVLPAWVAEMDFAVAHPIRRTLERSIADQDYGYPDRPGGGGDAYLATAFKTRMKDRFNWDIDTALVQPLADLVQGTFSAILAMSDPGDGVILQLPAYPPFHEAIHSTDRVLVPLMMRDDGTRHVMDAAELARHAAAPRTRMILLCNPQNPTGRVFERAELETIGRAAIDNNLIILSDEIHADLIYGDAVHIPIATLSPEIAARTITINSPTKSFNIPGLRCGVMYFGSAALRERFHKRVPKRVLGAPGILGIDATVAAWNDGQPWLNEVVTHLQAMRDKVFSTVAAEMPQIRARAPEGTYLGWLDCSQLPLAGSAFDFFHDRAKIAFSAGEAFDPAGAKFVRFNFATSARIIDQILGRMVDAVNHSNATRVRG